MADGSVEECHMAMSQLAYRRIAEKTQTPFPAAAPWSPPSVADLVARIDAALTARRPA